MMDNGSLFKVTKMNSAKRYMSRIKNSSTKECQSISLYKTLHVLIPKLTCTHP